MKTIRSLLAGVLLLAFAHACYALDDIKTAKAKYDMQAAKVRSGDPTADWREMRLDAVVGGVAGDYDTSDANKKGIQLFNDGKFEDALKIANEILAHDLADGDAHFLAMISYKHLGRTQDADKEHAALDAFFKSILDSGDGKTAATAWFTVTVHEEYLVLRLLLGMSPKSQSLVQQDGHAYDEMTVTDDEGKEHVLWFNTDTDMQIMENAMKAVDSKK